MVAPDNFCNIEYNLALGVILHVHHVHTLVIKSDLNTNSLGVLGFAQPERKRREEKRVGVPGGCSSLKKTPDDFLTPGGARQLARQASAVGTRETEKVDAGGRGSQKGTGKRKKKRHRLTKAPAMLFGFQIRSRGNLHGS
jgi:hypothetical protein